MSDWDRAIGQWRRRIAAILALRKAAALVSVWFFVWGTGIVVLRAAELASSTDLLWGWAAIPLFISAGVVLGLRQTPKRTEVAALVDKLSGCGGLLLAGEEYSIEMWRDRLPSPVPLQVRWHAGRTVATFVAGGLFVIVGLMLPTRLAASSTHALEIGTEADKLAANIALLKEETILDPKRADSLNDKLRQVQRDASGENPVKTLDALDHLKDLVSGAAREAADGAIRKTEELAKAEALSEALRQDGAAIESKIKMEAFAELAAVMQKMAAENKLLGKRLDGSILKQLKAGSLSREQLKKLAASLKGGKLDLRELLEKLKDARLIDPELLLKCTQAGKCDSAGLAALLKEHGTKMTVGEMLGQCQGKEPGRGGINEGPGAAAITWGDGSKEEGAKYKEEVLPPAALADFKKSMVTGLSQGKPVNGGASKSAPGALKQSTAGGGSANATVILPRHRATVEKYFSRH